mmetsp:Transcript_46592/g.122320  ORF Transcript_46592/g.122320 Transcript_46592/m.122320 type:complete len:243 (+) Transcript_46592:485-1213(+)
MTSSVVAHSRVSSLRSRRWVESKYDGSILEAWGESGAVNGSHSESSTPARLNMKPSSEYVRTVPGGSMCCGAIACMSLWLSACGNHCCAREWLSVQLEASSWKKRSFASAFLSSSLAIDVSARCTTPDDMRSDDIVASRLWGLLVSGKNSAARAGSAGKAEREKKGPSREPICSRAPLRASGPPRKLPSWASSAPSGFSRTRALSALNAGVKWLRMLTFLSASSSASFWKSGSPNSASVPSS